MKTLYTGLVCNNPDYIHTPLIEIVGIKDNSHLKTLIEKWYLENCQQVDYLLFTSRYSVKYFKENLGSHPINNNLPNKKIVSIGDATSKALKDAGFTNIFQVQKDDSYGVIDFFSNKERARVLIPRSNLALDIIPNGLKNLGFEVFTAIAYQNIMPKNPTKVNIEEIDEIIFTSPSTIDNFLKVYGHLPSNKILKTRGIVTEQHLKEILEK